MMMEFVEENKRLLRFYGKVSFFLGKVLLGFGLLWGAMFSVSIISRIGYWKELREQFNQMPNGISMFILTGLIAYGVSQFIRYLTERDYQPEWLLRHCDLILYAGAVWCIIVATYWSIVVCFPHHGYWANYGAPALDFLFLLLVTFTKVFALIGIGQILKRLLPIIGESKTLV